MIATHKEIDRTFLKSFYKDLVDEVGEIFQLFLEETPKDLFAINKAFYNKDYQEAALLLHKIAPCFYNIGLPQLTSTIKSIENSIHHQLYEEAQVKMNHFEIELNEYMPAIEKECDRLIST